MTVPSIGLGPTASEYSEMVTREPWPAPEHTSSLGAEINAKRAVTDLANLAEAHGWSVRLTYARGCWPSTGGRPSRQRDSYAVRMSRGRRRAVAVYVEGTSLTSTWSWDTLLAWDLDSFPFGLGTIGAFQDTVFGAECKPAWPTDWSCPYFGPVHGPAKPKAVRSPRA